MISQSEIDAIAADTIAKMVEEVPELSELSDAAQKSFRQFYALWYVTGHVDGMKEATALINA